MFITEQSNLGATFTLLANSGSRFVLVITEEEEKFYYRKEWTHNWAGPLSQKGLGLPVEVEDFLGDLPDKYKHNAALWKVWGKHLSISWLETHQSTGPQEYIKQIPELNTVIKHPLGYENIAWTLRSAIINLNDIQKWSREKIADWLETLDVNPVLNNPKETENV